MGSLSPGKAIALGVMMMVAGVVLPLLMVVRLVESTYFLNFLSYGLSLVGMFLAFIGLANYMKGGGSK